MYESLTYRDSSWTYSYIHPISYAYTSHSRRARAACIAVSSCVKKPANARLRNWIRTMKPIWHSYLVSSLDNCAHKTLTETGFNIMC